jgi:ABC-type uncharacterized transport system permease subunit
MILASAPVSTSPASLILTLLAALAYAWPALRGKSMGANAVRACVIAAWMVHALALFWSVAGDQPRFGFATALSMTAWVVAAVYGVESQIFPQLQTRWTLCAVGTAAVLLAYLFPGPALPPSTSAWMPLHLALGVASYGLFGTAVVHAWFMSVAENRIRLAKDPHSGLPLLTLERLTYRLVAAGFVLLSATLLMGILFSETVYGRALRWDHKTVFSVLSWLTFATLLIGRARFGWRGKRAVRVLYMGSVFLLLAYVGSRFVLEVILGRAA